MNETLLYIILGVLYLVFTALGRAAKKRQQNTNEKEPWSLEDALRDLQGTSEEQPEVAPAPTHPAPADMPDLYAPYNSDIENSPPITPRTDYTPVNSPSTPRFPPPKPERVDAPKESVPGSDISATIAEQLKNQKSAQTAIILGEILGRPKGSRGFPRRYP